MNTEYKEVRVLSKCIKQFLWTSLIITILFIIFLLGKKGLFNQSFCFNFQCVDHVFVALSDVVSLIELLLKILVASVTIFSVYHALNNYLSSIDASRANIHLTHLNTFKHYLISEVEAQDRLKIKSFNTFKWYNIAFPISSKGKLDIGEDYKTWIDDLNVQIVSSNNMTNGTTPKGFDYNEHQTRVISVLTKVGIKLPRLPRNDFYELEGHIFDLINKVNQEFCFMSKKVFKREYI
jgi:hypothetical protein